MLIFTHDILATAYDTTTYASKKKREKATRETIGEQD